MAGQSDPFWFRQTVGPISFGFTDARTNLKPGTGRLAQGESDLGLIARELGGVGVTMNQVHGATVALADPDASAAEADALIVDRPQVVAIVRVADCVPVVIVDRTRPIAAVVHAGRAGMLAQVMQATVDQLHERGADRLHAWVGPRACGRCYEVPKEMAEAAAAIEPTAQSVTSWGTPAIDVGAAVVQQLERAAVAVTDLGGCTIEDERFWSFRRQGDSSGRFGAAVVIGQGNDQ